MVGHFRVLSRSSAKCGPRRMRQNDGSFEEYVAPGSQCLQYAANSPEMTMRRAVGLDDVHA